MSREIEFREKIRRERITRELKRIKELIRERRPCEADWELKTIIERAERGKL